MHRLLKLRSRELFLVFMAIALSQSFFPQVSEIMVLLGVILWLGWTYAIGMTMNSIIPQHARPGTGYFKFSVLYIFLFAVCADMINLYEQLPALSWMITIARIVLAVSFLYLFGFSTRMVQVAVHGKTASFMNVLGIFFSLLIFPVGIWFIHREAQKALAQHGQ